jgi:hypothetical protein
MVHEKTDGVATSPASETLVDLLALRYREGGGFFIVEGTKTKMIGAPALEFHEFTHDIDDVDATEHVLY